MGAGGNGGFGGFRAGLLLEGELEVFSDDVFSGL